MNTLTRFLFVSVMITAAGALHPSIAAAQTYKPYTLDKKISIPGNGGYDYLSIDSAANRLYVSHGNAVNVFDLATETLVGTIDNLSGVHGIAIAAGLNRGFISDGKADAVIAFDLKTLKILKTIPVNGKGPDAIMYDPFSKRVFTFNGESNNAAVIDAVTLTQIGSVQLGGAPEFAVSDGAGHIYNNLEDKNALVVFDPITLKLLHTFPLTPCGGPTGLALDKIHHRLFTACRENKGLTVLDAGSGKVIETLPIGAGVDAVAYDPATSLIYCSNGDGTATIIRQETADKYTVVQTLTTQWKAKTLALDLTTKKLYFTAYDLGSDKKTRIADSFKLLVYKPSL